MKVQNESKKFDSGIYLSEDYDTENERNVVEVMFPDFTVREVKESYEKAYLLISEGREKELTFWD